MNGGGGGGAVEEFPNSLEYFPNKILQFSIVSDAMMQRVSRRLNRRGWLFAPYRRKNIFRLRVLGTAFSIFWANVL